MRSFFAVCRPPVSSSSSRSRRLRGELTGSRRSATPFGHGDSPPRPSAAASVPPLAAPRGHGDSASGGVVLSVESPAPCRISCKSAGRSTYAGFAPTATVWDPPRGCGGIGRHAVFRWPWANARGGSSPLSRIPSVGCYSRLRVPVPLSSRGLGRRPLTAETGVRIPVAVPLEARRRRAFFMPARTALGLGLAQRPRGQRDPGGDDRACAGAAGGGDRGGAGRVTLAIAAATRHTYVHGAAAARELPGW